MKNLIIITLLGLGLFSLSSLTPRSANAQNPDYGQNSGIDLNSISELNNIGEPYDDTPSDSDSELNTAELRIEIASDLAKDGRDSKQNQRPIVLFITAVDCPFCEQLRQEYFKFSTTDPRFILREIELGVDHDVVNFDGKWANHQIIADRYKAYVTPTVMFVGPDGTALNEPIIGILTMDYYHYYFEKALKESTAKLKGDSGDPS